MKNLSIALASLAYLVVTYGVLGPWLVSQKSTLAFVLGIVVILVIPAFIVTYLIKNRKK